LSAIFSTDAQADKVLYQQEMKRVIEDEDNLDIIQGMVDELIIEDNEVPKIISPRKNVPVVITTA
jgi:tRNA uridine 5-carboxymethylaminomethyl modification enzyme